MYIIWKEAGSSKTYFENMKNIRSEKKYRRALIKKTLIYFLNFIVQRAVLSTILRTVLCESLCLTKKMRTAFFCQWKNILECFRASVFLEERLLYIGTASVAEGLETPHWRFQMKDRWQVMPVYMKYKEIYRRSENTVSNLIYGMSRSAIE